ncbi:MAG: hypothetical protein GX066_07075, partial [Clostridiaceae bacterium]|nr:hypothetical protein [Clostridiaceae bacterium]
MVVMLLPVNAFATQSVMLDEIADKIPGDAVTISGSTSLDEVVVYVLAPNGVHVYVKTLKGPQFTDTFTLLSDTPLGMYTVVAGQGSVVATTTFAVVESRVTFSDVTVNVDAAARKVTVEGKISSGSGKSVTMRVFDPDGDIDYVGQTVSVEDGKFTFVFTPYAEKTGTYTVKLGAEGVAEPYVTTFYYEYVGPVPVTGVSLDIKEATLKIGQILQLTATVEPENATNKAVTWSSSNEQVATVDQNGVVTAVGKGTAIITVTTEDGGFTDTCIITVEEVPTVVTISDVTVKVDSQTGKVTVEGKVSSG